MLYCSDTWTLTIKEEFNLRVFEYLGSIWEWLWLHNEKLHSLHRSLNIVRVIKSRRLSREGHVAGMEDGKGAFKILIGKPTGKRPLGRPLHRWQNNIRMHLQEIGINTRN